MKRLLAVLAISFLTAGCASTSMLPKSAAEVDFHPPTEGKTGWSAYREAATLKGVTLSEAFQAAKAGLASADFALRSADLTRGVVMGEHGMTMHDWNVIAGVYLRERAEEIDVLVLVEGSKDIGFSGDVTSGAWTGQILNGMRNYLAKQ